MANQRVRDFRRSVKNVVPIRRSVAVAGSISAPGRERSKVKTNLIAKSALKLGEIEEVNVAIRVEVSKAAAGAGVVAQPAIDARALVGEALVEEVLVKQSNHGVAVEVPAAVKRHPPVSDVIPGVFARNIDRLTLPGNARFECRIESFRSALINKKGIDEEQIAIAVKLNPVGMRDAGLNLNLVRFDTISAFWAVAGNISRQVVSDDKFRS